MNFQNNRLINWTIDSGFNKSSSCIYDYYLLKEKFKGLEQQLDRLEKITSSKFFPYYYIHNKNLDLQLYMLKDTLEFIRSLVQEYSKKFLIETNFTFRLTECEQRVYDIILKIQKDLKRSLKTEYT